MEGDLTCEKVPSGYIINREGRHQSSTFFLLRDKTEIERVVEELMKLLDEER